MFLDACALNVCNSLVLYLQRKENIKQSFHQMERESCKAVVLDSADVCCCDNQVICAVFWLHHPVPAAGQGYRPSGTATVLGAANSYQQLQQLYSGSKTWKKAYKLGPAAACSKRSSASLCAAEDMQTAAGVAQLQMATSPSSYSSTNASQAGKTRLVAAAGNQLSCQTCIAFAVTAAAATAMAAALGVPVDECSISVQGLYFCDPTSPVRSCMAGWTLPEALQQLEQRSSSIPTASCLPYKVDLHGLLTPREMCKGNCSYANDYATSGRFESVQISNVWEAQQHIRRHGAVVTRFDVYSGA
jgi:hypothetical protein